MFLGIEFLPKKLFHELRQINCLSIDKKKWSIKNENQMLYHGFRGLEAKVHHKILKFNSKLWCKCTKIFHFNGLLSNQLPAPKALPPDGTRWGRRGESHHLGRQKYKLTIEMAKVLKRGEFWEIINPKKWVVLHWMRRLLKQWQLICSVLSQQSWKKCDGAWKWQS